MDAIAKAGYFMLMIGFNQSNRPVSTFLSPKIW